VDVPRILALRLVIPAPHPLLCVPVFQHRVGYTGIGWGCRQAAHLEVQLGIRDLRGSDQKSQAPLVFPSHLPLDDVRDVQGGC